MLPVVIAGAALAALFLGSCKKEEDSYPSAEEINRGILPEMKRISSEFWDDSDRSSTTFSFFCDDGDRRSVAERLFDADAPRSMLDACGKSPRIDALCKHETRLVEKEARTILGHGFSLSCHYFCAKGTSDEVEIQIQPDNTATTAFRPGDPAQVLGILCYVNRLSYESTPAKPRSPASTGKHPGSR